ncbi:MAG: DHH family phosphoesterase, partial [Anaerolineae bacterium]
MMATQQNDRDRLIERLFNSKSAYIISHIAPDADTLGAALGLGLALRQLGISVHFACEDPVPMELRFLPSSNEFTSRPYAGEEVIVTVDISDQQRIGKLYDEKVFSSVPVLVIDHHVTNTRFGAINWISDVPATSEMILEMLQSRDIAISIEAATCLLAGIIGDTQCFLTSNTQPSSLVAAA